MTFNSFSYFVFLSIVFFAFQAVAGRYRWLVLLAGSYVFYGFLLQPALLAILGFVTAFSYLAGKRIDRSEAAEKRKNLLFFSVFVNLSILVYCKYLVFLVENINLLAGLFSPGSSIPEVEPMVSIALSFFIFQAISYLADIYFRITEPEPHPGLFALYISFFPKLLQGPIERSGHLLPQLGKPYAFNYDDVRYGLLLFVWGLFLKTVVADRLAYFVDPVYDNVQAYSGIPLIMATYAYAFQLYFDFSGYTNMALGSARIFGISLTQNFKSPYLATSCTDFWRRWHISFSRWILDYIFQPLQMKWRSLGRNGTALALFVTFLLSGVWHGANWTFIAWGMLHGMFLVASTFYKPYQKKIHKILGLEKSSWHTAFQIFLTFNLVCFTYIFFRAADIQDALYIVNNMFNFHSNFLSIQNAGLKDFIIKQILSDNSKYELLILILSLATIFAVKKYNHISLFDKPLLIRWACYYCIFLGILSLHVSAKPNFIYFQF
jgi:D-alanyl-lipoteichoic acid acyltransferase DltB (MBOAT superfamily)